MGTITFSVQDSDEGKLRSIAQRKFGRTKGALSRTIVEAINKLEGHEESQDKKILEIARNGLHLGKIDIKKIREEIYGRLKGV
ncbi:hypothetical protein HY638_05225 [Candidatus Woesearchaeota archaeon]|nr:hypothetical protein [Candidatus Woesearchaeota archaeon]